LVLPAHNVGFKFAIMASGRGSNAEVLLRAFHAGKVPGRACVLISDQPEAPCLDIARQFDVPAIAVPRGNLSKKDHEIQILSKCEEYGIQHILLAGYMRILSSHFIDSFEGTILNIHPTLLPDFKGINTAERQINAGVKVAGATVHEVVVDVDSGPMILQGSIDVRPDETPETLSTRILTEVEHVIYPRAIWLFTARKFGHLQE